MATFAGYHAAGIPGALIATLALTAPALIIIILIAKFLENFSENQTVQAVFYGIRPTVAALIGYAVWELLQITMVTTTENGQTLPDLTSIMLCILFVLLLQWKRLQKLHPIVWILAGAVAGILLKL